MAALLQALRKPAGPASELDAILQQDPRMLTAATQVGIAAGQCSPDEPLDAERLRLRLGPPELAKIVTTLLLRDYMKSALGISEDRRYWRYTLACAVSCVEIAPDGELLAYVGGLLHDIGRLALMAAYPGKYANLLSLADRMFQENPGFDLLAHERLLFGLDHFAAGAWLAEAWRLPPWLRALTGKFDEKAAIGQGELVATVRAGTRLAHSLGFGYLQSAPRSEIRDVLKRLPAAWEHWKALNAWKLGEEYMRGKIQATLQWYELALAG